MKTDTLFYALFQSMPSLLFELMGQSTAEAVGYQFASIELKQTAFRVDGVFLPPETSPNAPVYFLEAQFQRDALLYRRLFAEIFLYLRQHPEVRQWQAVVLYPNFSIEVSEPDTFSALLNSSYVQVIYLEQLGAISELTPGLGILRLLVEPETAVPEAARGLIERVQQSPLATADQGKLVELIETIVVYTFPRRTREEIAAMLGITDLKETRVYQEGREEGREEGRQAEAKTLILRQLTRKFGDLPETLRNQVNQLSLTSLETLGEDLFDFADVSELEAWFVHRDNSSQPNSD